MVATTPYRREQQVAELAVLQASILTKRLQSTVHEISKEDKSPVTIADFAAQAVIIGLLHHKFPNDSFVGEESSAALRTNQHLCSRVHDLVLATIINANLYSGGNEFPMPASVDEMLSWIDLGGNGKGGDKGRFWVMDPVDGTAAFLRGEQYAVALSLISNGREVVGVLGCPNISPDLNGVSETEVDESGFGIMLSSVRGQGARLKTMSPLGLSTALRLEPLEPYRWEKLSIVGSTACDVTRRDVVVELARRFDTKFPSIELWSSHIRYAALIVGSGSAHFWVPSGPDSKMHIWDHAGTQLIFTELGGKITDLEGKSVDFGAGRDLNRNSGLVVAREEIHPSLLSTMGQILETSRSLPKLQREP